MGGTGKKCVQFQTFDRTCVNGLEVSNDLLLLLFQISSKIWKALQFRSFTGPRWLFLLQILALWVYKTRISLGRKIAMLSKTWLRNSTTPLARLDLCILKTMGFPRKWCVFVECLFCLCCCCCKYFLFKFKNWVKGLKAASFSASSWVFTFSDSAGSNRASILKKNTYFAWSTLQTKKKTSRC